MNIRFRVNLKASFERGIDAEAIQTLRVDPSALPRDRHQLINKHLLPTDSGLDVVYDPEHATDETWVVPIGEKAPHELVEAKGPRLDDLLEALKELESHLNQNVQAIHFLTQPTDGQRLRPGTSL